MATTPNNIFISYKRPRTRFHACLASRLADSLATQLSEFGSVFIDKRLVAGRGDFAYRLVDEGLNQSKCVISVVDAYWLEEKNLKKLGAKDDWITFEVSYGLEHDLFVVLLCNDKDFAKLRSTELPGSLELLKQAYWFEWRSEESFESQLDLLAQLLRTELPEHQRIAPLVAAAAEHSQVTNLTASEAETRLGELAIGYSLLVVCDWVGMAAQGLAILFVFAGLFAILDKVIAGLALLATAALLLGLGWTLRRLRTRFLERALVQAMRTKR